MMPCLLPSRSKGLRRTEKEEKKMKLSEKLKEIAYEYANFKLWNHADDFNEEDGQP